MGCQSCGKKHPLSRANQAARHFSYMPRRKVGLTRSPPPPPKPVEVAVPQSAAVVKDLPEEGGELKSVE